MTVLTRTGLILESPTPEIKKELTVRPLVNNEYGFPPPPFKVYRTAKSGICVPRFYGTGTIEEPTQDKRPAPPGPISSSLENSGMPHTRMKHTQQQLKQVTVYFLYHAAMGRRRYPWP